MISFLFCEDFCKNHIERIFVIEVFDKVGRIDKLDKGQGRNPRQNGENKRKREYPFYCADRCTEYTVKRAEHRNTAD